MDTSFIAWVKQMADDRGWSYRDLALHAEVSIGSISAVLTGKTGPSPYVCRGIANAFSMSQIEVFRMAGLLDEEPATNPLTERLAVIASKLTDAQVKDVIEYAEFVKRRKA